MLDFWGVTHLKNIEEYSITMKYYVLRAPLKHCNCWIVKVKNGFPS